MPNWCNNLLTIVGPPEQIAEIVVKAYQKYSVLGDGDICEKVFSFQNLVPIPADILDQPYDPFIYKAEHKYWGAKWGACNSKIVAQKEQYVTYSYDTAWCPGETFLLSLSAQYPECYLILSYAEEMPSRGRYVIHNGNFEKRIDEKYRDYVLKAPSDDENENDLFWAEWQDEYLNNHDLLIEPWLKRCFKHEDCRQNEQMSFQCTESLKT